MLRYITILILPYLVLLLDIFRNLLNIRKFESSVSASEFVSVVIACRNEQNNLPRLLNSLALQNYRRELYEVIIVDDNSTDKTQQVAQIFRNIIDLKVIRNTGEGKKMALKTGIDAASAELILTTDADCEVGADWIRTITSFYEIHKPDLIICPVKLRPQYGFFGKFQELEFLSLQGITAGTATAGYGTMCNGANLAFSKTAYHSNKKNLRFDIATGDDVFLLHSMKKQHAKISWFESPEVVIETEAAPTITSFFRQRRRWASKATAYKDKYSIGLGIVTFVTNLIQAILMVAMIFEPELIKTFLFVFVIKSIPDFLILSNTTTRYDRTSLMKWFLPSQLFYPFYVLIVAGLSLFSPKSSGIGR